MDRNKTLTQSLMPNGYVHSQVHACHHKRAQNRRSSKVRAALHSSKQHRWDARCDGLAEDTQTKRENMRYEVNVSKLVITITSRKYHRLWWQTKKEEEWNDERKKEKRKKKREREKNTQKWEPTWHLKPGISRICLVNNSWKSRMSSSELNVACLRILSISSLPSLINFASVTARARPPQSWFLFYNREAKKHQGGEDTGEWRWYGNQTQEKTHTLICRKNLRRWHTCCEVHTSPASRGAR